MSIDYGVPVVKDRAAPESTFHDAVETLRAVQGILDAFFSKNSSKGKPSIPTPELSPVPKFRELPRDDDRAGDEEQSGIRRERAQMEELALPGGALETRESHTPEHTVDKASQTESSLPSAALPNGTKQLPPSKTSGQYPDPKQARLRQLADLISRNIDQLATANDAAALGVKTATAALELANAIRPPQDTIMNWFATMSVVSAVRLFQQWGAFEVIPAGPGESITYAELARRIDADEGLVGM